MTDTPKPMLDEGLDPLIRRAFTDPKWQSQTHNYVDGAPVFSAPLPAAILSIKASVNSWGRLLADHLISQDQINKIGWVLNHLADAQVMAEAILAEIVEKRTGDPHWEETAKAFNKAQERSPHD